MTLLTLIPCGSSPNEASSTLSTPEDHFWGKKKNIYVCLKFSPISRAYGGESDAQPLRQPLHTEVNFMRKHFARDASIRLAICFCPLIKLSIMDERLGLIFTKQKKEKKEGNTKTKHSQQTTCTPTS